MINRTITLSVDTDAKTVFEFLANIENLKDWATEYCLDMRKEGEHWKVQTPGGEVFYTSSSNAELGTIDLQAGPTLDHMGKLPVRVHSLEDGGSVVTFTFNQPAAAPREAYLQQYQSLLKEVRQLGNRFGLRHLDGHGATPAAFYPGHVVKDVSATKKFYVEQLGFKTVFDSEFYAHVIHPEYGVQFGIMATNAECASTTPDLAKETSGKGHWISLEVESADAERERLWNASVEIVQELADQPWGERNFVIRDPDGVLVFIGHKIEISDELKSYLVEAA